MSEQECLSAIHAYREQATMTDFPNRIAALFFTSECNFRCPYCHNPQLLHKAKNLSFRDLERICTSMKKQWIGGVVITGGEPTLQKSLPHTIAFLKKRGYEVKLDTNEIGRAHV